MVDKINSRWPRRNLVSLKTSLNFEPPHLKMQQDIQNLKQKCNAALIAQLCPRQVGEVGSTHPWESSVSCAPPPKIAREHVLNRQQLSRGLFDFAHILYNFDHVPFDVPRTFKVNGSAVKVTAWHNVSASKNAIFQARISSQRSNLVKIMNRDYEPRTERNT